MAYVKQIWEDGVTLCDEEHMNHIEEGIFEISEKGDTSPIGIIAIFGGDIAPNNWLICDGSAVSRVTYASLFAVIGTNFGGGDGSTTFNLPDFKDRTPVGINASGNHFKTIGSKYGEETHTLTVDELAKHNHSFQGGWKENTSTGVEAYRFVNNTEKTGYGVEDAGENQPHNNIQPSLAINFIIKAF